MDLEELNCKIFPGRELKFLKILNIFVCFVIVVENVFGDIRMFDIFEILIYI